MNDDALAAKLQDAPIGFAVVEGPAMTFTVANAQYQEMVGRTGVVGRAWADVFPELVDTPTHAAVRGAYEGQRIEVQEFSVPLLRQGEVREGFYSFVLDPTRGSDGTVNGFVVLAVEVTELVVRRREAEQLAAKLQESEARFRTLFASIDEGFSLIEVLFDGEGNGVDYRFLEANDAFCAHTGLPAPVGKRARELVPELDGLWAQRYGQVLTSGQPARFENHDPAMERWFDVFATPVGDPKRRQVALVFKNVSARKHAELQKQRLLEAEQAARQEAEANSRLKDEFLATVSHELRTPLNAMLGWVTLMRTGKLDGDKKLRALDTIERNARAQAQLIEDLLDVSSILEGKLRLHVEPTDLSSVIDAAVETVRLAAESKGVRLQVAITTGSTVMGDAQRLQQVVWNLLANAIKFTPRGGRVQVVLEVLDSAAELVVSDTGIGIGAEFLPYVFDRFRQADGGTARRHGGLGLGLSIVRHLTELHGGTVRAHSDGPDRGARFMVRLPLALLRRRQSVPPATMSESFSENGFECPHELSGLKVLAVDDEQDSRDVLRAWLEECGAEVRVAGSVSEALTLFRAQTPDVVVSDIAMPGEDGFALIGQIRALTGAEGSDTPVIALTSYARAQDRAHCLMAGFSSHVPKPVEPVELLAVVASLARRRR